MPHLTVLKPCAYGLPRFMQRLTLGSAKLCASEGRGKRVLVPDRHMLPESHRSRHNRDMFLPRQTPPDSRLEVADSAATSTDQKSAPAGTFRFPPPWVVITQRPAFRALDVAVVISCSDTGRLRRALAFGCGAAMSGSTGVSGSASVAYPSVLRTGN